MTQLQMMIVKRGTDNGIRDFLIPETEVAVGDTVLLAGLDGRGNGHRIGFRYAPVPRQGLADGTVVEYLGQRMRIEEGLAIPLVDSERPFGEVIQEGAITIDPQQLVRVMTFSPVSRITGPIEH